MSKSMAVFLFHFFKSIKIKLSDKALKFGVSKKFGKNLSLNSFFVKNIN